MARTIAQISRVFLPGTGFVGSTGNPSNLKALAVFKVTVTSYTTGGESLKPADLGFSAIDFISVFNAVSNATQPAGTALLSGNWDNSGNKLILNAAANTEVGSTQAATAILLAYGDGLADAVAL